MDAIGQRINLVEARVDALRRTQLSTAPADRTRAEAAIARLYANEGRPRPRFIWVASPLAGALAFAATSLNSSPIRLGLMAYRQTPAWDQLDWETGRPALRPDYESCKFLRALTRRAPPHMFGALNDDRLGTGRNVLLAIGRSIADMRPPRRARLELPAPEQREALIRGLLGEAWGEYVRVIGRDRLLEATWEPIRRMALRLAPVDGVDQGSAWLLALTEMEPGQFDHSIPFYALLFERDPEVVRVEVPELRELRLRQEICASAGPWWSLADVVIVSERPNRLRVDEGGRPHAEGVPAITYADGTAIYAWHGVLASRGAVGDPSRITIEMIQQEPNAEVRRVLIERIDWTGCVRDGHATLASEDAAGRLWRISLRAFGSTDVLMVEVENSTPERDGRRKRYFLRVPPHVRTAREAVAWTFDMATDEYVPMVQT